MSEIPEGWNSLDVRAPEAEPVEGLLSNGTIVHAEWWGPVPQELYKPGEWDGSGWGFEGSCLPDFGRDAELIAWRPWSGPPMRGRLYTLQTSLAVGYVPGGNIEAVSR